MSSSEKGTPNRLIHETSPYLLQHAYNPVDWYPWGPEALQLAQEQNRPILLSIGYSACHWCHVMERESFENEAIAELMNRWFVCIKVDREERPDLDDIYMAATVAMNHGQGLADDGVSDTGPGALFRRDVFPTGRSMGTTGLRLSSQEDCRLLGHTLVGGPSPGQGGHPSITGNATDLISHFHQRIRPSGSGGPVSGRF